MNGGRCVTVLKAGTAISTPSPRQNIRFRSNRFTASNPLSLGGAEMVLPFSERLMKASGTSRLTSEGSSTAPMILSGEIWPPIHSMVVVTSPITVHAPPALAAITTREANNSRSSRRAISRWISEIMTMVVVRLSRIELRKNATKPTSHISLAWLVVPMREVMTSKPSWASITSTMVIAPIRKNTICAVEATDSSS